MLEAIAASWRPSLSGWRMLEAIAARLEAIRLEDVGGCWRPSLLGWRPSLSGWRMLEAIAARLEAIPIRLEDVGGHRC